jgi:hypothetical protein
MAARLAADEGYVKVQVSMYVRTDRELVVEQIFTV